MRQPAQQHVLFLQELLNHERHVGRQQRVVAHEQQRPGRRDGAQAALHAPISVGGVIHGADSALEVQQQPVGRLAELLRGRQVDGIVKVRAVTGDWSLGDEVG